jgi:uncharacterized membrane protein YphA (DoxX/SURF4 family)/ribosomal protein S18 acetylase RimI-like enzyme
MGSTASVRALDLALPERDRVLPVLREGFEGIYRWHAKRTLHRIELCRALVEGDRVVAFALLERIVPEVGYVYYVAVASDRRGQGYGGRLVDEAIERFRRQGARIVYAAAEEGNAASRALFLSRGFRTVERDEPVWQEGGLGARGLRGRMMLVHGEVLFGLRLAPEPSPDPPAQAGSTTAPNSPGRVAPRETDMSGSNLGAAEGRSWWVAKAPALKTVFRVLLGVVWLIDGVLKFTSGFVDSFQDAVIGAGANAPSWMAGWFNFWSNIAGGNAPLIVYTVGGLEVALGLALVLGLMRKVAYAGGVVLSLLIWAVPEGFGGPYQTGAGGTDVGTGVIYAIAFLGLILINATYGPSRWSLDYYIEGRFPRWASLAEFRGATNPAPRAPVTAPEKVSPV